MLRYILPCLAITQARSIEDVETLPLDDLLDNSLENLDRRVKSVTGMCSDSMVNLQRLARFTSTMLVKEDNMQRSGRSAAGGHDLINQNPGRFCLGIWRSLKIVKDDLSEIERPLVKAKGAQSVGLIKSSIEQMREALQEQMNMYGVRFQESDFHKRSLQRTRQSGKIGHIRNRAEVRMSNISKKLDSVHVACNRFHKRRSV